MTDDRPSPGALWKQAGGDRERYIALMWEYGYLIEGPREPLPCGWPGPVTNVPDTEERPCGTCKSVGPCRCDTEADEIATGGY